jgi:DNA-binding transcriptional ArsR family regulator
MFTRYGAAMGRSGTEVPEADFREAVVETLWHPLRARLLTALAERPDVTIRQLAKRLDESSRRVRHQVNALVDLGLVEVTGEASRRGVIERHYASRVVMDFPDETVMPPALRLRFSREIVRLVLADIGIASAAGTFATIPDRYECRFYGEVDDQCLEELTEIHNRAYREIADTVEAGRERTRESGEPGIEVVSALFFFEAPLWKSIATEPTEDDAKRD